MNIFKTYLKAIPSYLSSLLLYVGIFIVLLVMTVNSKGGINGGGEDYLNFHALVSVTDKDGTEESRALMNFIEDNPNITLVETEEDKIQDSLYYRKIEYALCINSGFGEGLRSGNTEGILSAETVGDSNYSMYMETQLSTYLDAVRLYIKGGFDSTEAGELANKRLAEGVETVSYQRENGWENENSTAYFFYNFMPYILLMMVLQALIPTFSSFMNEDLRSRTLCSPTSPVSYTVQMILGAFVVCIGILAAMYAAGAVISGGTIFSSTLPYSLLQLFVFMLFGLALAALLGVLCSDSKKKAALVASMASNVLGLGMSFLCGVFVSQSLLGEEILNVGKLLPAYWYVRANNMIYGADGAVFDSGEVMACIGVQALFAAAVFAVALVASGVKKGKRAK